MSCAGFNLILGQSLKPHWIEEESDGSVYHQNILARMGWDDNDNVYMRRFLRIEVSKWDMANFHYDETCTLPGWVENNDEEIKDIVYKLIERIKPIRVETGMDKYVSMMGSSRCPAYKPIQQLMIVKFMPLPGFVPPLVNGSVATVT